jgi:CHAT domain-containing protein
MRIRSDHSKTLFKISSADEFGKGNIVRQPGLRCRSAVWQRIMWRAWVIAGTFLVSATQPLCQAADEGTSTNQGSPAAERNVDIADEEATFFFCWDRWKEDQSGAKRFEQASKDDLDFETRISNNAKMPSRPLPQNMRSLVLFSASMREVNRYVSSAPPEVFNRFARQFLQDFVSLTQMKPPVATSFETFSPDIRKLAASYRLRGDDQAAAEFYHEEIDRCQKAGSTAQLGRAMDGLGILLAGQGKMEEAERVFRDALTLRQQANLGDEVRSWMFLAGLQALGHSSSAGEDFFAQALARLNAGRVNSAVFRTDARPVDELYTRQVNALEPIFELAWQFQANGQYVFADRLMSLALNTAEKWLGPDDLRLVRQRKLAACCAFAAGNRAAAVRLLQEANDSAIRRLNSRTWPMSYEFTTNSVVELQGEGTFAASFGGADELAQELIGQKGYAFYQRLQKRRLLAQPAASPVAKELWQQLVTERNNFRDRLMVDRVGEFTRSVRDNTPLLEAKLAAALGSADLDSGPSLARLTAMLPKGSAYVDYALCDQWTDKISFTEEWCALVVQPNRPPAVAHCGSLQALRAQIDGYLWSAKSGNAEDSDLSAASKTLYSSLVAPVDKLLAPEAKTVFVCPDGPIGSIGLAALLDDSDHFWCEKRDVRYVTGGRAIIEPTAEVSVNADRRVSLLGDPLYDMPKADLDLIEPFAGRKDYQREMEKILHRPSKPSQPLHLDPLPGTLEEVQDLQTFFDSAGLKAETLVGTDATEQRFRSLSPCTILHLATHGDYLKELPARYEELVPSMTKAERFDMTGVRKGAKTSAVSPMLRSFLALAGAETTLNQWQQGNFPKTAGDGLLMADEVMDMDFSHTLLVTLSGCETGVGLSVRGEGSVGIQRAFLIAGARHVLATLWPIRDLETVDFMKAFYARVVQGGEAPPAALSAVQRDLLVQRREKKGLAAAVYLTAPYILTSASQ